MKHSSIVFAAFLSAAVGCSCNGNKGGEDVVMEDVFDVIVLEPNDNVKEAIAEGLLPYVFTSPSDYSDTICIRIRGSAIWKTLKNDDPFSIKITGLDTSFFYIVINEDTDEEAVIRSDRPLDRPLIQTVVTMLDTGTYSLHCVNCDESPKSLLDRYWDTIARTDIDFEMYLRE